MLLVQGQRLHAHGDGGVDDHDHDRYPDGHQPEAYIAEAADGDGGGGLTCHLLLHGLQAENDEEADGQDEEAHNKGADPGVQHARGGRAQVLPVDVAGAGGLLQAVASGSESGLQYSTCALLVAQSVEKAYFGAQNVDDLVGFLLGHESNIADACKVLIAV